MISIVVSSYQTEFFNQFLRNVKQTIGENILYEIIRVDNPNLMGICEAYNKGASQTKYPYLVFAHEDILFHTPNWGHIIEKIFSEQSDVGLVGCAGGVYKSYFNTGWAIDPQYVSRYMIGTHGGESHFCRTYKGIPQSVKLEDGIPNLTEFSKSNIVNEEVLILDGMFLATRKRVHEEFPFDQNTFKGFHSYDLDYSLQLYGKYKVVVNHNILIEHFSAGRFDLNWFEEMEKFNKKWKSLLPVSSCSMTSSQKRKSESHCFELAMRIYKHSNIPVMYAFKPIYQKEYIRKIGVYQWATLILNILLRLEFLAIKIFIIKRFKSKAVLSFF